MCFFSFSARENERFAWQTIVGMACWLICEFSLIQYSDFVCIVTCSICHHRSWFDVTVVRIDSCNACTLCGLLFVLRWSSAIAIHYRDVSLFDWLTLCNIGLFRALHF